MAEGGAQNLFDEAMTRVGGNDWKMLVNGMPVVKSIASAQDSISFADLAHGALRGADNVKTVSILVDYLENVGNDFNFDHIASALGNDKPQDLPLSLQPRASLPQDAKMQLSFVTTESGAYSVIKTFWFSRPVQKTQAVSLVTGRSYLPVWRAGPWAWKKAFQSLLDRIPGTHIIWNCLQKKEVLESGEKAAWKPTKEGLQAGIEFINKSCPAGNSQNEQLLWILTHIKADDGNPISGWPERTVCKAAANKAMANSAADPETFFPLNVYDLKPVWNEVLLPRLFPLFTEFGLLALGWPGVGKTPLAIILSMALGRYRCQVAEELGAPGWRRGKMMDNFRNRPGEIQEAVLLDDATISCLDISDIKHFLDVGEATTAQSRYCPAKFTKNQFRAILDNEFNEDDEPDHDLRSTITFDEFFKLTSAAFGYSKKPHIMAVLKRAVTVVAGKHAMYVRLPTQHQDSPIFRFFRDSIAEDWLVDPGNKAAYSAYKRGQQSIYPGFDDNVTREQSMILQAMQKLEGKRIQEYMSEMNQELLQMVSAPAYRFREVPPTPASQAVTEKDVRVEQDGSYSIPAGAPVATGGTVRANFSSDFSVRKRYRHKSPGRGQEAGSASSSARPAAAASASTAMEPRGAGTSAASSFAAPAEASGTLGQGVLSSWDDPQGDFRPMDAEAYEQSEPEQ